MVVMFVFCFRLEILVPKLKIACLLFLDLFGYAKLDSDIHFFCVGLEIPFFGGNLAKNSQNFLFKIKFGN